jgi:hypothetical protein
LPSAISEQAPARLLPFAQQRIRDLKFARWFRAAAGPTWPVLPLAGSSVGSAIVGGNDHQVLELNREAYARIKSEKDLAIVPGATHLFEEPGTLEKVARLAVEWFTQHL